VIRDSLVWLLTTFDWFVLIYFVAINTSYLALIVFAIFSFKDHLRRAPIARLEDIYANPLAPPVSVLMPAYNEEAGIVESVRAMLALRYPALEVVVIDDGSSDGTLDRLDEVFDLVAVPRVQPGRIPLKGDVITVFESRLADGLVVVQKRNGGRADALNVGIDFARSELICMVDADSILDPDALLHVVQPFLDDPENVVGSGGVVRVVNDKTVKSGRVVDVHMPHKWLPRIQVVEYLRAFLLGRTGWSRIGTLMIVSGAFGLFRRDLLFELGGLDTATIGEDAELVMRLHHLMRQQHREYKIVFVSEPVSWTEVPDTNAVLARQRRRWSRGLAEVLWKHRSVMLNPRYGRVGMLGAPYYLVFELLAPIVEIFGVLAVVAGLWLGLVNIQFGIVFALVAVGYAVLISVTALAVEELSFHRYDDWADLRIALVAAVLENFGYRQLTAVWRLQGLWAALRGTAPEWGVMTRKGFNTAGAEAQP